MAERITGPRPGWYLDAIEQELTEFVATQRVVDPSFDRLADLFSDPQFQQDRDRQLSHEDHVLALAEMLTTAIRRLARVDITC